MARRTGRKTPPLNLSLEEREVLERYVRRGTVSQQVAMRARIVLRCADGLSNRAVAKELRHDPGTVGKWRRRFVADRLDGLCDAPRPGAPRQFGDDAVEEMIVKTLEQKPRGATQWSTRLMAKQTGMSRDCLFRSS